MLGTVASAGGCGRGWLAELWVCAVAAMASDAMQAMRVLFFIYSGAYWLSKTNTESILDAENAEVTQKTQKKNDKEKQK